MKKRGKRSLIIGGVVMAIILLIFVPVVVGGSAQEIMDMVGFMAPTGVPEELQNPVEIMGEWHQRLVVHKERAVTKVMLTFSTEVESVKATLKCNNQVDILLGLELNTTSVEFSNSYTDMDGNTLYETILLCNQLNMDDVEYITESALEGNWIEIEVKAPTNTVMTVTLVDKE